MLKLMYQGNTTVYGNSFVGFPDPAHNLYLIQNPNGTISADKMKGLSGEIATLSNTPSAGYEFGNYSITGASLTGSQFMFGDTDVSAEATFNRNVYTLTLQNDGHGTIAATKTTGYAGDTVTLSNSYNTYYRFNNYTQTGGSLNGSTFTFGSQNATAKANFKVNNFTATGSIAWGNNLNSTGQGAKIAYPTLHINAFTGASQAAVQVTTANYCNYGHTGTSTASPTTTANRGNKFSTTNATCLKIPTNTSAVSLHVKGTYTGNHAGQAQAYVGDAQRRATLYVLGVGTQWNAFFPKVVNGNSAKAFDITKTSATMGNVNAYNLFRIDNANDTTGTSYNCGNRWAYNRAVGLTGTFTATGIAP